MKPPAAGSSPAPLLNEYGLVQLQKAHKIVETGAESVAAGLCVRLHPGPALVEGEPTVTSRQPFKRARSRLRKGPDYLLSDSGPYPLNINPHIA